MSEKAKAAPAKPVFTKEQLINSKKYAQHKDTLTAILDAGTAYAHEQVESLLTEFLKRKV